MAPPLRRRTATVLLGVMSIISCGEPSGSGAASEQTPATATAASLDSALAGYETAVVRELALIQLIAAPRLYVDLGYVSVTGFCHTAADSIPRLYLTAADYEAGNHRSTVQLINLPTEQHPLCSGRDVIAIGMPVENVARGFLRYPRIAPRASGDEE